MLGNDLEIKVGDFGLSAKIEFQGQRRSSPVQIKVTHMKLIHGRLVLSFTICLLGDVRFKTNRIQRFLEGFQNRIMIFLKMLNCLIMRKI